jgi:nicotinamidase-related amidase
MSKALLIVDVLEGIFDLGEDLHAQETFLTKLEGVLAEARRHAVTVIYARHSGPPGSPFEPGSPGWQIHARVQPRPSEIVIDKEHPDAFQGSGLDQVLSEAGVEELYVCGFATEGCIDSTVRSAYSRDLPCKVFLLSDCHTTTKNAVLEARQIVEHHNLVLARFATVLDHDQVEFRPPRSAPKGREEPELGSRG